MVLCCQLYIVHQINVEMLKHQTTLSYTYTFTIWNNLQKALCNMQYQWRLFHIGCYPGLLFYCLIDCEELF